MTTAISGPAGSPIPSPEPSRRPAQAPRTDPFAQLLTMQMDWPTLGGSDSGQESPAGLAALSGNAAQTGQTTEPLLTFTLLRVLEKLLDVQGSPAPAMPRGLPVSGPISQGARAGHQAVDIAVPVGSPVRATMAGQVIHAGWNNEGYGNLVIVENGAYRTYFAHLESLPVTVGQTVTAGQLVGLSGNTGNSTGPHVHYEVRFNDTPIDPDLQA